MKVNSVENNMAFTSKFVPNKLLEKTFDRAYINSDRFFLEAVKSIQNDGKNDVFELAKIQSRIDLKVNGTAVADDKIFMNHHGDVGRRLINGYVNKILDNYNIYGGKYQNLTPEEKTYIRENVDVIKMFSEQIDSADNYIEQIQQELNNIKTKIDARTRAELQKLKESIFANK